MLFSTLLTNKAPCFHDVRTYWSPESVARVTGQPLTGKAANGIIHLINSGATAMDCTGAAKDEDGSGTVKRWWEMTDADIAACLDATDWVPRRLRILPGRRLLVTLLRRWRKCRLLWWRVNLVERRPALFYRLRRAIR